MGFLGTVAPPSGQKKSLRRITPAKAVLYAVLLIVMIPDGGGGFQWLLLACLQVVPQKWLCYNRVAKRITKSGFVEETIMKQYIVDAFTNKPFAGNPAAVCVMESWPSEESMMKLAMENNLSETAFIVKEEKGYHLRWFTPGTEVELCGHATLASSFVILNFYEPDSSEVKFNTLSGELTIRRKGTLCMKWISQLTS